MTRFGVIVLALCASGCCNYPQAQKAAPHMIVKIADCEKYENLNPHFKAAFAFLRRTDLKDLKPGKYEIDGNNCWASISEVELTPLAGAQAEVHRKYIDIQAPLTGPETMGLFTMDEASKAKPFSEEYDCAMLSVKLRTVTVQPGECAIFFPPDGAHAPCHSETGPRKIRKAVIKVKAAN